ncbi:MAG: glycosyl transferase [Muribaculum sp.]|nr:glycosyl transferase [Muribaculum sp.]
MIPKVIHYCWFGGNPLPESAKKCIASWQKYLPDYEIKLWNEENFDVNIIKYTQEAYQAKKYAFVSDYARFWILYNWGGLYFDTDVEVIRPLDDIIARGPFMGCERSADAAESALRMGVAPGLGLGVNPGQGLYDEILKYYAKLDFLNPDGTPNTSDTVVTITSRILCKHGLKLTSEIQLCAGIWIYPNDYFSPKDIDTKITTITENTRSIHHYDATWAEWYDRAAGERGPKLKRILGEKIGGRLNVAIYVVQKYGFSGTLKKVFKR